MPITIRKSGNAQIVSLPKSLLEQLGVGVGDDFDVMLQDGTIILKPIKKHHLTLGQLLQDVTPEMFQTEEDEVWLTMPSTGKEWP
ncbi:MAG: AbrB/MazE/SpoVT family DNA-binding domain-containing protein [Cardiobacteriaceae bacterium]|nr:AbrB/MazE/SpoVT family DNA-binding domain-containing protein [Cardiobacteriaceae bacterium]